MTEQDKLYPNYDMNVWRRTCNEEITKPLEGKIKGTIPLWIQGTLLRNGPGCQKIGDYEYQHVFDGLAIIHRFAIKDGRATYQSRFVRSDTYKKNMTAKRIVVTEFGTMAVPDPCRTIFDRISSTFQLNVEKTDNTSVSVYPFGDQIYAMTEIPVLYKIDPVSLETLEKKEIVNSLFVAHTAHPHVMSNGDTYNVGLHTKNRNLSYAVVKFTNNGKDDMFETAEIVSSAKPRWRLNPAYMHSFGITENYFVIVEQPLSISLLKMLSRTVFPAPFSSTLVSYPQYETEIILIHRDTAVVTRYTTDTVYFMHMINSFEEDGKLMVDLCSYKDGGVINAMYLEAIKSMQMNPDYGQWCQSRPKRIIIPLDAPPLSKVETKLIADIGVEAPRINYDVYNGKPYRYFYGMGSDIDTGRAGSIIKVDTITGNFKLWSEPNCYPSEPIFVPHPDAKEEDEGVLLSSVIWSTDDHVVTLLVLNASDLKEMARIDFKTPSQSTRCFHGWYFPDQTTEK